MKRGLKILIALLMIIVTGLHANAQIGVNISIRTAPPPLPVYDQPFCPGDGYIWVPGYWAYGDTDYYWVPGTWVRPPQYGLYWTPGYWGFSGGYYGWHRGYWGHHVGFYGGINYGFGYGGSGYGGGMWSGNTFRYNTAVNRINPTVVHNTYINKTVVNNTTIINNHNSFNGQGGVMASPSAQEQQALREQHIQPTNDQVAHETLARSDRSQFAAANHGHPAKLTESRVLNTHVNNQQNNTIQSNNVKPGVLPYQKNTNLHKGNSAPRQNAQAQVIPPGNDRQPQPATKLNQANFNQPQVANARISASHEKNQFQPGQSQIKNNQINRQGHQFGPHGGNGGKSNNGRKGHEK